MPFNAEQFQRAEFAARTVTVEVAGLADFFGPDEKPEFTVRGLTAIELHRAMEAGQRQHAIDGVIKALASQKDQVESIRRALGLNADTPGEVAKRIEMLVVGSVSPKLDHHTVVKIGEVCPVEFMDLTNRIVGLTGQGADRVKPPPSSQPTEG
jgi:hypothetical protein